jgi:hypothetical protein
MTSETHSGVGTLWNGDVAVLRSVPYSVTVTTRESGLGRIDGNIDGESGALISLILEDPPPKLVLELEDGRRWECYLANSSGRLVNRGRLK